MDISKIALNTAGSLVLFTAGAVGWDLYKDYVKNNPTVNHITSGNHQNQSQGSCKFGRAFVDTTREGVKKGQNTPHGACRLNGLSGDRLSDCANDGEEQLGTIHPDETYKFNWKVGQC